MHLRLLRVRNLVFPVFHSEGETSKRVKLLNKKPGAVSELGKFSRERNSM